MSERLRAEIEQGRKAIADRIVDAQRQALQQARDAALEEAARAVEAYHSTISHSIDIRCAAAAIRALKGPPE